MCGDNRPDLIRVVDQVIRLPLVDGQIRSAVTIGSSDNRHARRASRLDVANVITNIDTAMGFVTSFFGGMQQGQGMWFRMGRCVTTDKHFAARI